MNATQVLYNATILTMDPFNTIVSALAIKDNRILATGDNEAMLAFAGPGAEVRDMHGATVIPGFYDAHGHICMDSECNTRRVNLNSPPIGECKTFADCFERLKQKAAATPAGQWVQGYGFDDTLIAEKRFFTRQDLDAVSTEHPIYVSHISGHTGVANTCALTMCGMTKDMPDPEGGVIRREADGTPNGVVEETAIRPIATHILPLNEEQHIDAIEAMCRVHASRGITTTMDAGVYYMQDITSLRRAAKQGKLPIRVLYNVRYLSFDTPEEFAFETDMITRGGVKIVADGSIQCYTAYLSKPFHTPHGGDATWCGYPMIPREKLFALVDKYHKAGVQCVVHTNGDASSQDMLDAVEAAQKAHPVADPRFLMVHAQNVREDQLDRFKALGVTPSFFTVHTYYWGDRHKSTFLGPERAEHQNPMRSALERGIVVSAHNDAPVTPANPLHSIWCCVNRQSSSGEVIGEKQRISVTEALRAHTISPAWQNFEEKNKGSLEPGKFADIAVLDTNPLTCPSEKLLNINVKETLVGGKTVFLR